VSARQRWAGPALGLALALCACASGPAPPADRFWRLAPSSPEAPARPAPLLDGALGVERLRTEGLDGQRALVWSEAGDPHEVRASAYQFWVEPPADQIQELLTAYLAARGVAREVLTPEMRLRPDWSVAGKLSRFERVVGDGPPRVVLELRLTLLHRTGAQPAWSEIYREEVAAAGPDVADAVAAFDSALAAAFARFEADLEKHAPQPSAAAETTP
jgi:cholesterol transport system auxiliary component